MSRMPAAHDRPHQTRSRPRWTALALGVLAALAVPAGCARGPRNFENENDRLRRENLELRQSAEELNRRLQERLDQLRALESRLAADGPAIAGVSPAELPLAVRARLDRYSGPVDVDGDGRDDLLRLYVHTLDQQGRFIPVKGRAVAQVVRIAPGREPEIVVETSFAPAELDAAYRSGLTGTHYTLEVPLPADLPAAGGDLTVKLTLTDAATGADLSAQQAIRLRGR